MAAPATEATPSCSLDDLNADVVAEILLRLPSASVLRCRAVCRAWRGITSNPAFVAVYSRRRPLELVVQRHGANGELDTIPLDTLDEASRRRVDPGYPSSNGEEKEQEYMLLTSCGDLLLFERRHGGDLPCLWVCSPARRQWSAVALPHRNGLTVPCGGMYLHRPSGEHRLLFLANDTWDDESSSHYVGSVAAPTSYRRLGPARATVYFFFQGITPGFDYRGKLHWLDHHEVRESDKILAFDTVSETFRRTMSCPRPLFGTKQYGEIPFLSLLEMDGRLAMAATPVDGSWLRMDLWVLEDYDSDDGRSWRCRHRIDLSSALSLPPPPAELDPPPRCWALDASVLLGRSSSSSNNDDVILLGDREGLSVVMYHLTEKRVLKRIQVLVRPPKSWRCTHMHPFVFRDSLETHGFFHLHHKPILQTSEGSAAAA